MRNEERRRRSHRRPGRPGGALLLPGGLALLLVGLTAAPLSGRQASVCPHGSTCPAAYDDWREGTSGMVVALGANVLAGGLTAGIRRRLDGGSFRDGFVRGGLGGAGTWAGKRLAAEGFGGAGALGRAVAAVGSSVTHSAGAGDPTFHRILVPLGPLRLDWYPSEGSVFTSVDLFAVGGLIWIYSAGLGASLNIGRTLDSGVPVFMAEDWELEWGWHAKQLGGSVILRGDAPGTQEHAGFLDRALTHERIHVIQYDQAYLLWSEPLERRLMAGMGLPPGAIRRLDLSLHGPFFTALGLLVSHDLRPWEVEAHIFARTFLHP